jgi:hypothetical protein
MALLLSDAVDLNKAHHGDSKQPAEQEANKEKQQFVHTKSILSCGVSGGAPLTSCPLSPKDDACW